MAGSALSTYGRFVDITGPTYFTGPREVINDAQKTNYETLGYLLRGQQMSDILQGGSRIKDNIMLSTTRVTHSYLPGEPETYQQPQVTTTWTVDWRFFLTYMAWTDQTVELNADASPEAKFQAYKNEWYRMQQDMWTDWTNYVEEVLWAVPDKSKMEAQDGQEMYSIPCFVNEHTNGLPPANYPGGAWTTVMGINPTAAGKANWVPFKQGYAQVTALPNTTTGMIVGGLVSAFDNCYESVRFRPPPIKANYFEEATAQPWNIVFCSKAGKATVRAAYRNENDRWQDFFDPFGSPLYAGMPFVYVGVLDTAPIYPTGASAANSTEYDTAGTTNAGPRFTGIQPKYLRSVFHRDRYMKDLGIHTDVATPTQHTIPVDTWGNTICRSRRRQFQVYPTADIPAVI